LIIINKVILLGRLVADPETRYTQSNIAMTRFKLAVNRQGKKEDGQPTADFFQVTAWRATAEFVQKYFSKGQQVLIEGYLRNNQYTDKDGNKRYSDDIHASQVYFADSKRDSGGQGYQPQPQQAEQTGFYDLDNTEDLPF
jgi:single-strand DNA-binding protein